MIKHAIIALCAVALSGCTDPVTRQCAAFGTPLTEKWDTGRNVGDKINYANESGATIALELTVREDSEPYEATNYKADTVTCKSNSDRQYSFENSDVELLVDHDHLDYDPSWERPASHDITIRHRPGVGNFYRFALDVPGRETRYTDSFDPNPEISSAFSTDSRFIENVQIGSNQYPYAIEQKLLDLSLLIDAANTDPLANIVRVIMAEGGGLVQFELLNGEVYNRM